MYTTEGVRRRCGQPSDTAVRGPMPYLGPQVLGNESPGRFYAAGFSSSQPCTQATCPGVSGVFGA